MRGLLQCSLLTVLWATSISAAEQQPEHKEPAKDHAVKGTVYFDQKRYSDAAREFEAALKIEPTWVELHFNAGVAHEAASELPQAVASFRAYLPAAQSKEADEVRTRIAKLEIQLEEAAKRDAEAKAKAQQEAEERARNQGLHFVAKDDQFSVTVESAEGKISCEPSLDAKHDCWVHVRPGEARVRIKAGRKEALTPLQVGPGWNHQSIRLESSGLGILGLIMSLIGIPPLAASIPILLSADTDTGRTIGLVALIGGAAIEGAGLAFMFLSSPSIEVSPLQARRERPAAPFRWAGIGMAPIPGGGALATSGFTF